MMIPKTSTPFFKLACKRRLEAWGEKKWRLLDWSENNAWLDWVTPCSSHIPKQAQDWKPERSVKHSFDQILTSTQSPSHCCQLSEH